MNPLFLQFYMVFKTPESCSRNVKRATQNRSLQRAIFAKKVFFFSRSNFFNSIYSTPKKFPGGLKVKRTGQVIHGHQEL